MYRCSVLWWNMKDKNGEEYKVNQLVKVYGRDYGRFCKEFVYGYVYDIIQNRVYVKTNDFCITVKESVDEIVSTYFIKHTNHHRYYWVGNSEKVHVYEQSSWGKTFLSSYLNFDYEKRKKELIELFGSPFCTMKIR